jgi:hypothetical protein
MCRHPADSSRSPGRSGTRSGLAQCRRFGAVSEVWRGVGGLDRTSGPRSRNTLTQIPGRCPRCPELPRCAQMCRDVAERPAARSASSVALPPARSTPAARPGRLLLARSKPAPRPPVVDGRQGESIAQSTDPRLGVTEAARVGPRSSSDGAGRDDQLGRDRGVGGLVRRAARRALLSTSPAGGSTFLAGGNVVAGEVRARKYRGGPRVSRSSASVAGVGAGN